MTSDLHRAHDGRRARWLALLLTAALAWSACSDGEGFIFGERLVARDCDGAGRDRTVAPYDESIAVLGFVERFDRATIRVSPGAANHYEDDQLTITFADVAAVRERVRTEGVATLTVDGAETRVGFAPLGRCDFVTSPLEAATGTLTLTALGVDDGRVTGTVAFDLVDRRDGALLGEAFVAEFDFPIVRGTPNTLFADDDKPYSLDP